MRGIAILLLLCSTAYAQPNSVFILTSDCNPSACYGKWSGSGVVVAKRDGLLWIITNNHVVNPALNPRIGFSSAAYIAGQYRQCNVIARGIQNQNTQEDLALLTCVYDGDLPVATLADTPPGHNSQVIVRAHDGATMQIVTNTATYANRLENPNGWKDMPNTSFISSRTRPGMSGGGVYNQSNELVAIIWGQDSPAPPGAKGASITLMGTNTSYSNWGLVVDYETVRSFLDKHMPNRDWLEASAPPPPKETPDDDSFDAPMVIERRPPPKRVLPEIPTDEPGPVQPEPDTQDDNAGIAPVVGEVAKVGIPIALQMMGYGALGATGVGGIAALGFGAYRLLRNRRRRKEDRVFQRVTQREEVPPKEVPVPFPRKLDEARNILRLADMEGRVPVIDRLRGVFIDDEVELIRENGTDEERRILRNLLERVDARVESAAPKTVRPYMENPDEARSRAVS